MTHTITLCASCPLGQGDFAAQLAVTGYEVRLTACMSGCTKPSTVAFRAAGKTAYLFGEITADDLGDLIIFAQAYHAAPDGTFSDARLFGALRHKAIARIPG
jgi:predicted metal-binding protein